MASLILGLRLSSNGLRFLGCPALVRFWCIFFHSYPFLSYLFFAGAVLDIYMLRFMLTVCGFSVLVFFIFVFMLIKTDEGY